MSREQRRQRGNDGRGGRDERWNADGADDDAFELARD
jgi:hypothetical protein